MKVTRGQFMAYRQQDAIATKATNRRRKIPEAARREARMLARIKDDKLPYTPEVMSWLSRKLDKPARKIVEADVQKLLT